MSNKPSPFQLMIDPAAALAAAARLRSHLPPYTSAIFVNGNEDDEAELARRSEEAGAGQP